MLYFDSIMEALMGYGVDVDARTRSGMTPMMFAAKGGQVEIMQWLWEQGAQVNAQDIGGMTSAHYAAQSDCAAALELLMTLHMEDLIKHAGYLDSMAQAGQPVKSDTAVENDNIVIDRPSRSKATPLHIACNFDAKDAIDVLLKYQVQVCAINIYIYIAVFLVSTSVLNS
jgi:ankyrin repeat protein